ncbi:MAG TPA: hypothetical protein VFZ02_11055 [Ktedonobacteraceae bacterium]
MISEKANMLQKEKQALREKADLLQEESHSLPKMIGVKEEVILLEVEIYLQDQLIDALQSQVSPLTRRTNWMTSIATK